LRGVWNTATYTRLQRPEELGSKAFYTEEEAIAEYKKAAESDAEVDPRTVHYDWKEYAMDAWQGGHQAQPAHLAHRRSRERPAASTRTRGAAAARCGGGGGEAAGSGCRHQDLRQPVYAMRPGPGRHPVWCGAACPAPTRRRRPPA